MRRVCILAVLCLATGGAAAWASTHARPKHVRSHRVRHPRPAGRKLKHHGRGRHARTLPIRSRRSWSSRRATNAGSDPVLFGDQTIEATTDSSTAGQAAAFPFSNSTSGSTASISVYVDASNAAQTLVAGLYADQKGHPGALLAQGSLSSVLGGTWNQVPISSAGISSRRTYWVAVLGQGGQLSFRDRSAAACRSETAAQTSLASLPSSWRTGGQRSACPISAYVNGYLAGRTVTPAPSDMTLPAVTGLTTQGQTLATSTGGWSGNPTNYSYQWRHCLSNGANCANINGATQSSYTLAANDVGSTIRAVVTATNSGGSTPATSSQTATIAAPPPTTAAPTNTALPAISGTPAQGQTLTSSNGSWNGSPTSYGYQWRQCDTSGNNCTNIDGATAGTYTPAAGDIGSTIRVVVTATNSGGSSPATSTQTAAIAALAPTAGFSVSPASPVTGQAVHLDASSSKCFATPCTYTWADDPPSGGTWPLGSGLTLDFTFQAAATKYVTLTVTDASNQTDTIEHDVVVGSAPPAAPSNTALPTIGGTPTQGQTLTASNGSWNGSPLSYAYQWRRCDSTGSSCANINGATGGSYALATGDVGNTVDVVVTATNAGGKASAASAQTATVTANTTVPGQPTNVVATGGNGSATVSWSAPSDGGSPITSYTVTPYVGATAQSAKTVSGSPPSLSTTISGLTNGTSYAFTVTAANANGAGQPSALSNAVTPASTGATSNCFPNPGSCGFPDPGAGNVGVPSNVNLTASGSITISTPGAVIQGLDITGAVTVAASNVTIKDVRITTSGGNGATGIFINNGATGTTIEDSTIRGAGTNSPSSIESAVWNHYDNPSTTALRDYFYNCADCWEGAGTISDSYMIVNGQFSGAHYEDIYACGTSITANHDTLLNPQPQTATVFGDTICGSNNFTVTNSLLAGGGFLLYPAANSSSVGSNTMNVSGNRFARCLTKPVYDPSSGGTTCAGGSDSHGYYPNGGFFETDAYTYCPPTKNQTWTGNVWDDNGATVDC